MLTNFNKLLNICIEYFKEHVIDYDSFTNYLKFTRVQYSIMQHINGNINYLYKNVISVTGKTDRRFVAHKRGSQTLTDFTALENDHSISLIY